MTKRVFTTRYQSRERKGIFFTQPSLTEQSAYDDVNIHNLINRGMNNLKPNLDKPLYGIDLTTLGDYQSALQIVADAKNVFESMSPELREKFHNSPEEFLSFVENKEENFDEGVKLGIFSPDKKPLKDNLTPVVGPAIDLKIDPKVTSGTDGEKSS
ncbi:internal scaffolding protein [Sigmofec virus UA08Rod_5746]|uniref:Internal scaffolding protein n=1 Tax=Sigmofec virus UA08Rod_5746 TaxID=2929439 RepID=A0A976N198_9VIRU|nr:internal scaffolding protein [Sigmofec virus UA08Rod_5746]